MSDTGKYGYPLKSDKCIDDVSAEGYAALVLPGGFAPDYMRRSPKMLAMISTMAEQGKPVAAICHAPWMLCSARRANGSPIAKGHRMTCFSAIKDDVINAGAEYVDEAAVVSKAGGEVLITSRTPGDLTSFVHAIIDEIAR